MSVLIETEVIDTIEGLEAMRSEWDRLLGVCRSPTPFQHPEWLIPWWRSFGQGRLMVLAMRVAGRLCGLAPLYENDGEIAFLGRGVSDYLGPVLDPSVELVGTEALFNHLAGSLGWRSCCLEELQPHSALFSIKPPEGLRAERLPGEICLKVKLPDTIDAFREAHGRGGKCGSKRAWRRFFARGLTVEAAEREKEFSDFLDALFRLHAKKWASAGQGGVLQGPEIRAFHEEAALGFQKKRMLRLYRLVFEGREVAALYGFVSRDTFYAYLTGYDPDFARMSPGKLILLSAAEDCIARGITGFDLLRGSESYKYGWDPSESRNSTLMIKNGQRKQNRI